MTRAPISETDRTDSLPRDERKVECRTLKVLIIDDHPLYADALAQCMLTISPAAKVIQASTFKEAMGQAAAEESPNLILLDYGMPGVQGLEGLRDMLSRFPDTRIAMVSGSATGSQMMQALELGAAGFIPKDLKLPAILKALEMILIGETFVPAKMLKSRGMSEKGARYHVGDFSSVHHPSEALTPREREVLAWVECGKSNRQIADIIETKEMTIAFHLRNVFKKLGVGNRTEAASVARKLGLCGEMLPSTPKIHS